jgi:hypothetical protein
VTPQQALEVLAVLAMAFGMMAWLAWDLASSGRRLVGRVRGRIKPR